MVLILSMIVSLETSAILLATCVLFRSWFAQKVLGDCSSFIWRFEWLLADSAWCSAYWCSDSCLVIVESNSFACGWSLAKRRVSLWVSGDVDSWNWWLYYRWLWISSSWRWRLLWMISSWGRRLLWINSSGRWLAVNSKRGRWRAISSQISRAVPFLFLKVIMPLWWRSASKWTSTSTWTLLWRWSVSEVRILTNRRRCIRMRWEG